MDAHRFSAMIFLNKDFFISAENICAVYKQTTLKIKISLFDSLELTLIT